MEPSGDNKTSKPDGGLVYSFVVFMFFETKGAVAVVFVISPKTSLIGVVVLKLLVFVNYGRVRSRCLPKYQLYISL